MGTIKIGNLMLLSAIAGMSLRMPPARPSWARRGAQLMAALALVGACGVALIALAGRGPAGLVLLVKPASVEYIKRETARVEQMNAKLAREDAELAKQEKAEEMRVIKMRKSDQLEKVRARARKEAEQIAKLKLQNAKLTERLLKTKLQARRASIGELQAKVKAGDYSGLTDLPNYGLDQLIHSPDAPVIAMAARAPAAEALKKGGVQFVSEDPFASGRASPLVHLAKLPAGQTYWKHTPQLAGDLVKACQKGQRCHRRYRPETQQHWDKAKHSMIEMESGLPLPVGPGRRVAISALTNPGRDTARPEPDHSIYGVYTGSFFGPSDHRFADNFVPVLNTSLHPSFLPQVWVCLSVYKAKPPPMCIYRKPLMCI